MKIQKWLLGLSIATAASCSNTTSKDAPPKQADGFYKQFNMQHQFKVHGCAVNYNGTDLYMNGGVSPWIKALGKNYRKVKSADGVRHIYIYIYDDIGVRLVEQIKSKKLDSFRFRLARPPHDIKKETEAELEADRKRPDSLQVRTIFKDAIDVDGVLVGAYPMHDEVRSAFTADKSGSYSKTVDCVGNQESQGGGRLRLLLVLTILK